MFGNYINGEWITTGATFDNRNPANTSEVVGTFVKGTAAEIDAAAAAAAAAFPTWSATSGPARGNILHKAADILDKTGRGRDLRRKIIGMLGQRRKEGTR